MKAFPYLRIANLIFNQPHAVLPSTMDLVTQWADRALNLNMVNVQVGPGIRAMEDDEDYAAMRAAREADRIASAQASGVQVVPIHGLLVPRSMHIEPCQTATSYEDVRQQLTSAAADPMIEHIVLDVDSPGGSVAGCMELAATINALTQQKPITAVVNYSGYSAAYALASAASQVVVSPSSGVGSIGVIARHMDVSKYNDANGVKITTIYAGDHKNDLSPYEPLTDQGAEFLRQMVLDAYQEFVGSVAKHRGMDEQAVRDTQAQVYFGPKAVSAGLADKVEAPQDAVNRIAAEVAAARSGRAKSSAPTRRAIASQAAAMQRAAAL